MLQTYAKFILLGVILLFSSCSWFQKSKVAPTVSVNELLQADIDNSNATQTDNANASEELGEDLDEENLDEEELGLNEENLDEKNLDEEELGLNEESLDEEELDLDNNKKVKKSPSTSLADSDELSLEDDPVADTNSSNSGDDSELSLEDDSELSLKDDSVADTNSSNSGDDSELSLEDDSAKEQNFTETEGQSASQTIAGKTILQNITYKQENNLEVVSIEAKNKIDYVTNFNKENSQLVIKIKNIVLSEKLKRPYFMKDFLGGSIVAVNSYQDSPSSTANIVVQLRNGTKRPPQIVNTGSTLKISYALNKNYSANKQNKNNSYNNNQNTENFSEKEFFKKNKNGTLADFFLGGGSYHGSPISLKFEEVPVRHIISYIASEVGANILVDDKVSGKISLKLRNIPWDQALALVLKSKGLGYVREQGGVLRISSLNNLKKEKEALVSIIKSKESLKPLSVKIIHIAFAKASQLASKLKIFLTPKRGKISFDARSNVLIITDTAKVLKKVVFLAKKLDTAPRQVSIEAKFIEANQSFSRNLGVNWGFTGGKIDINGLQGVSGPVSVGLGAGGIKPVPPESLKGLAGSVALTLGSFKFLGDLSSILAIAEQDQRVKVISTPTVVVLDKQKASITNKGENLSIARTETDGTITESITRTPIVLQLDVSPQIASDGNILLDVNILREFAGGAISTGSSAKPINSRSVKSKVLIKNGDTLVIGGIFQKDTSKGNSGVPFLSKLPLFGWLFKYQSEEESKNELMVFLTPTIL